MQSHKQLNFDKNHYNCKENECLCINKAVHPKITCKLLRGFVYKFYLYHYETGYLRMWDHSEAISSYKKDLYLNCHCKEAIKGKFNELLNKSIDEVIYQMMKCDKELLENLVIENIYTFGAVGTLSKEWANIYNTYFYNPNDIENRKHLSFHNEDDPLAGLCEEGGACYFSWQLYNVFAAFRIVDRSPIGAIVKIYNKAKLPMIDAHSYYAQSIPLADRFEFYPNHKASVNKINGFLVSQQLFVYRPLYVPPLLLGTTLLEIPHIIFTPMLLITKCFGVNIFLHIHQVIISITFWMGVGLFVMKYI